MEKKRNKTSFHLMIKLKFNLFLIGKLLLGEKRRRRKKKTSTCLLIIHYRLVVAIKSNCSSKHSIYIIHVLLLFNYFLGINLIYFFLNNFWIEKRFVVFAFWIKKKNVLSKITDEITTNLCIKIVYRRVGTWVFF